MPAQASLGGCLSKVSSFSVASDLPEPLPPHSDGRSVGLHIHVCCCVHTHCWFRPHPHLPLPLHSCEVTTGNTLVVYVPIFTQKDGPVAWSNWEDVYYGGDRRADKFFFIHLSLWYVHVH